jgi:peroxiredoxin
LLEVGDRIPDFALRDPQREEVTQEYFEGSIGVMAFYPMAFSGG